MKLYCAYDKISIDKKEPAERKCDICGKLLCRICGYSENGIDYCNECWNIEQSNNHYSRVQLNKLGGKYEESKRIQRIHK